MPISMRALWVWIRASSLKQLQVPLDALLIAILGFVTNWTNFYNANANANANFGLSVEQAAYGAAFGDAIGVALLNPTLANLQTSIIDNVILGDVANA
jgi:hypothetical protein